MDNQQFAKFLEERLYPDLYAAIHQRDQMTEKLIDYNELRFIILHIKEQDLSKITTKINIGCEFYVKAKADIDLISVETGIPGLYIELKPDEALEYIDKREVIIKEKLERYSDAAIQIQQHIDAFSQALRVLGNNNPQEVEIREDLNS
ncbi:unnamed protein product [Blepharisma stoltei]|uniref:Prefoldin subunit alpha n=1 Tax=Blepharisma stoltei TaxID=1481888 RepID=A0AAU9IRE8_9CILI|nr:unnamed protein product [Blepharisma stoltei]